jgi:thioredoxin reductase
MRSGKVEVLFETNPKEVKPESVVLDVKGEVREIPNDYVWIFAGGIPPFDFLKKIGIQFGMRDMTLEASSEAKKQAQERRELAKVGSATASA